MSEDSKTPDAEVLSPTQKKFVVTSEGIKQRRWGHRPHLSELFSNPEVLSESNELLLDQGWLERLGGAFEAAHLVIRQKETIALALQQENQPEETLAIRKKAHELKREIEGIANELRLHGEYLARKAQQLVMLIEQPPIDGP